MVVIPFEFTQVIASLTFTSSLLYEIHQIGGGWGVGNSKNRLAETYMDCAGLVLPKEADLVGGRG